jgi:hypothetical protein
MMLGEIGGRGGEWWVVVVDGGCKQWLIQWIVDSG